MQEALRTAQIGALDLRNDERRLRRFGFWMFMGASDVQRESEFSRLDACSTFRQYGFTLAELSDYSATSKRSSRQF